MNWKTFGNQDFAESGNVNEAQASKGVWPASSGWRLAEKKEMP